VEVAEEEVDKAVDSLRERFSSLKTVDRPARVGDFVTIDLQAEIDGEEVDSVAGVSHQVGAGNLLDGLDEALDGLSAGEETTFGSPLTGGPHAGENALVTVKAEAVKERELPEADDAWAELASSFDTVAELRDSLRGELADAKRNQQVVQAQEKLIEHLLDTLDFPAPEGVVKSETNKILGVEDAGDEAEDAEEDDAAAAEGDDVAASEEDDAAAAEGDEEPDAAARDTAQAAGSDAAEGVAAEGAAAEAAPAAGAAEDRAAAAKAEATRAVRAQLLLDALASHLGVTASNDELMEFMFNTANRYGINPEAFINATMRSGELPHFYAELVRSKAGMVAATQVGVQDADGNEVDVKTRLEAALRAPDAAEAAGATAPADALEDAELAEGMLVDEVAIDLDGLLEGQEAPEAED
jgi:trigger factor